MVCNSLNNAVLISINRCGPEIGRPELSNTTNPYKPYVDLVVVDILASAMVNINFSKTWQIQANNPYESLE